MKEQNLHQKLVSIRKSIPYLQKENKGKQYNYVSSAQALSAIRDKMNELSVLLVPRITGHSVIENIKGDKQTSTYFTEADFQFSWVNADNPEETITCEWYGQGVDIAGEKGVGKAATYAEKYFILKFFNIPTDKDDPDTFQTKVDQRKPQEAASEIEINEIKKLMKEKGVEEAKFFSISSISSWNDFPSIRVRGALDYLAGIKEA